VSLGGGGGPRHDSARKACKIPKKILAVLGGKHPNHEHERARDSLLEIGKRIGNGPSAFRIMAAIEPQFASRRAKRRQPPLREPAPARGPLGLGHPDPERAAADLASLDPP